LIFSIIIPFYNKTDTIVNCIQSVVNQDYKLFEIIIIDDFSEDSQSDFLTDYVSSLNQNSGNRFVLLKNAENRGPGYSRNRGIEISKGDFLIFLDSDDQLTSNYLSSLFYVFSNFISNVVISTTTESANQVFRPNIRLLNSEGFLQNIEDSIYKVRDFVGAFCIDPIFCGCGSVALRKESLGVLKFCEIDRNFEDWLFFYHVCSQNASDILMLDNKEGLIYFNESNDSLSRRKLAYSDIKYPSLLSDKSLDIRFSRYIYFNWLFSTIKRTASLKFRWKIILSFLRFQFFNPFPIWKFFIPSILLLFKLDSAVIRFAKLRKVFYYAK
jgi:glycosyltransferase involved in cell wall biosynthesis